MRPRFLWQLGRRALPLGERTLVMGVVNVTPDSFSDGGLYAAPAAAIAHALRLLDEGADLLDIGGESTRPGAPTASASAPSLAGAVTARQELERVLPVIQALRAQRPAAILSVDTYKAEVARAAVQAGADIVNDVSGFLWDPAMASTIAALGCGAVLMHTRGLPHQWRTQPPAPDIVALVRDELAARAQVAIAAGIARDALVLDPGLGFGKNFDENYPLLARLSELHELGFPLLIAASRKSFLAHTLAQSRAALPGAPSAVAAPELPPPGQRDNATLAASVAAALHGAHIVRVHSVAPTVEALAIADKLRAR